MARKRGARRCGRRQRRSRCVKGKGFIGDAFKTVAGKALRVLGAEKLKDLAGFAINRAIDVLPGELHIPGYQFCGPGTKLRNRLARGERGINPLDELCREHDIAYSKYADNTHRSQADRILQEGAWKRVTAPDSGIAEKAAALVVTNALKAKRAIGGGIKKHKQRKRQRQIKKVHRERV
jgi:hypothetical protein